LDEKKTNATKIRPIKHIRKSIIGKSVTTENKLMRGEKMKIIALNLVFVGMIALLVMIFVMVFDGLQDSIKENREETINEMISQPGYEAEGIMKIGDKWDVDYIQHNIENEYQIGISDNGELKWYTLGKAFDDHRLKVVISEGLDKTYLTREKDEKTIPIYKLPIPKNEKIQAGTLEELYMRHGGRNYYRDVHTKMVYPN
jgi:hypothetical protein